MAGQQGLLTQGREFQGIGITKRIRDYRDDGTDEALRTTRSLKDRAGVSHGIRDHRESGPSVHQTQRHIIQSFISVSASPNPTISISLFAGFHLLTHNHNDVIQHQEIS